jgi:hypothetical protein
MSLSHWALTWSSAMPAFKTEDGKRAFIKKLLTKTNQMLSL